LIVKLAVFPTTTTVPSGDPFFRSVKVTAPDGFPVPATVTVRFVKVKGAELGLARVT